MDSVAPLYSPFDAPFNLSGELEIERQFLGYQSRVFFQIESGQYRLRTAQSLADLKQVFALRYRNFNPFKNDTQNPFEWDSYDLNADHIVIEEASSNRICGTYRILCSLFTEKFYSESEFDLDEFKASPGVKLELGRACIDERDRNGVVMDLLWKGIAQYMNRTNSDYLFGCSSVDTLSATESANLIGAFRGKKHWVDEFEIRPIEEFQFDEDLVETEEAATCEVPSLLKSYFLAGAKVHGQPAIDRDFRCVDFLTILNVAKLNPLFQRRYFKTAAKEATA